MYAWLVGWKDSSSGVGHSPSQRYALKRFGWTIHSSQPMRSKSTHMSTFRHSSLWAGSDAAAAAAVGEGPSAALILSILFLLWRRLWLSLVTLPMVTYLEFSTVCMRLYGVWLSLGRFCLEKMTIVTRFTVGWCIFLKRDLPRVSRSPLPSSMSGSPEASWPDTRSPWYSQYFNRAVTLKTFQGDLKLLGNVPKLPRKRCSSWHNALSRSQWCFLEWYKSTVARLDLEKAGSLIRSSASWTRSLVEMDDMSNVTFHLSPSW